MRHSPAIIFTRRTGCITWVRSVFNAHYFAPRKPTFRYFAARKPQIWFSLFRFAATAALPLGILLRKNLPAFMFSLRESHKPGGGGGSRTRVRQFSAFGSTCLVRLLFNPSLARRTGIKRRACFNLAALTTSGVWQRSHESCTRFEFMGKSAPGQANLNFAYKA